MQDEKEKLLKTLAERITEEQQKKQGWEQTTLSGGLPGHLPVTWKINGAVSG